MDPLHPSGPYMEGTIAAAESNYLAGSSDFDQILEGVDWDDIDDFNEETDNMEYFLDPQLFTQNVPVKTEAPPQPSSPTQAPSVASDEADDRDSQPKEPQDIPRPTTESVSRHSSESASRISSGSITVSSGSYRSSSSESRNSRGTNNGQPLHINTNVQPAAYPPNYHYPNIGLAGRNGPPNVYAFQPQLSPQYPVFETMSALVPTFTDANGQQQYTPTQVYVPVNPFGHGPSQPFPPPPPGYWGAPQGGDETRRGAQQAAPNGYFPPNQYGHQSTSKPSSREHESDPSKKRKRRDSISDLFRLDDEPAVTQHAGSGSRGKVQHHRTLKQKGDITCDPEHVYTEPLPRVGNWRKRDGGGPHFQYTPMGQWADHLEFSAAELRHYLDHCPRDVKVVVQQPPAQSNSRQQECDRRCRYTHCPVESKIIRPGFLRVVFDEYYDLTSDGRKDPFKVAGCMHLWCFEQCVDPYEFYCKRKLIPDDRVFPKEAKNPMALNRDSDKCIVNGAFKPWMIAQCRKGGIPQIPRNHRDSLTFALVSFHLANQVLARQTCRDKRNRDKAEEDKNTLDVHLGDVSRFARRCLDIRSRKRTSAKRRRTNSPHQDGVKFVPPTECGRTFEERREPPKPGRTAMSESMFRGSVDNRLSSPVKQAVPVSAQFEHYVPTGQESSFNGVKGDPDLTQQQGYGFPQMPSSGDFSLLGMSSSEDSSLTHLNSSGPPPFVKLPIQGTKPEVRARSPKRRASELENEDSSLFDSPRSKRFKIDSTSSQRRSQGAPLRRSPRNSRSSAR